jgi:miniconductance mechanosensitive channel
MPNIIRDWLLQQGLGDRATDLAITGVEIALVVILAAIANIVAKRIVVRGLENLVGRTASSWDDILVKRRLFHRLSHLAPALVVYVFAPSVLDGYDLWVVLVQRACLVYMLLVTVLAVDGVLSAMVEILRSAKLTRDLPVKSIIQVLKLVLYSVAAVSLVALVIGQSLNLLLGGLGAMTAVLMLVFKDPILGLVAGVQLSANQMVARGDWIEMPKYGADGDVLEVALTTVKVQNWDKTITTIPTYALITESFKNWRGMSESGGRRIKRAVYIDIGSIRFCDEEMLERFSKIRHIEAYLKEKRQDISSWNDARKIEAPDTAGSRRLTNVGTFRAYVVAYLRNHPMVHQEMTFLVRQLAPTDHGLPIEIYVFSRDQEWSNYEDIQADIFDHILAIAPAFDLRIYQHPSGADVRDLLRGVSASPSLPTC